MHPETDVAWGEMQYAWPTGSFNHAIRNPPRVEQGQQPARYEVVFQMLQRDGPPARLAAVVRAVQRHWQSAEDYLSEQLSLLDA
jgi:hypothetical protein